MLRSVLAVGVVGAAVLLPAAARAANGPEAQGWKLVWSDEFDKPGLPDAAKWDYEEGWVRNNELQYYTRGRQENARVEGGNLVIEGRKEEYKLPAPSRGRDTADYTSASLTTRGKASWQYGRIEVRAKLPQGKGVWPAIWMLGDNIKTVGWPACGEVDIMEFVGHTPDKVHATLHYRKEGKHASKGSALKVDKPWEAFHVYAVEWTPEQMVFTYDDQKYHTFDLSAADDGGDNPFRHPQYLILNLALGGSWGGKMDDSVLPQKFLIDYVRVYQK